MAASVELQGPMALYVCSSSSERMSMCKGVEYERQSQNGQKEYGDWE